MSSELRRLAVDELDCPYCGQPKGRNCRTSGGHSLSWPHGARYRPMIAGWSAGYVAGQQQVVRAIDAHQSGEPYADPAWLERYLERIRKEISDDA